MKHCGKQALIFVYDVDMELLVKDGECLFKQDGQMASGVALAVHWQHKVCCAIVMYKK